MSKFNDLFNKYPQPIVNFEMIDNKTPIIICVNRAFLNKFSNKDSKEQLVGTDLNKLIVPENKKEQSKKFDKRTFNGLNNNSVIERVTPNGVRRFVYTSISYNENKGFAIYKDITDNIQSEEHIRVLNRIIRHNLRNKLNIINARAEMINEKSNSECIKSYTEDIMNTSKGLENLTNEAKTIDNILGDDTNIFALNLKTQVDNALKNCSKNLNTAIIKTSIDPDITVKSGEKLHKIIESIVDNAIRYNTSKKPEVKIYTKNTSKYVVLCIEDNGPGIPRYELDIINQNKEITELNHGSGLGLWLTKWAIEC